MANGIESLKKAAEALAGRPVELGGTKDNMHVALWFSFGCPPPSKEKNEELAYLSFIEHLCKLRRVGKYYPESDVAVAETVESEEVKD